MQWLNGGRKWRGFLLLVFLFALFVIGGYIKSETIIRDVLVWLFGILGGSTVAESWVTSQGGGDGQKP